MKILLVAPPWFAVPPEKYGGIESVVALLADGLVDAGHDVALCASGDSGTKAELRPAYDEAQPFAIGQTGIELRHLLRALGDADEFDVIGDHSGPLGLLLGGLVSTPVVHTVHGPLEGDDGELYAQVCRLNPEAQLISLSESQREPRPDLPWLATCHNALDLSQFPEFEGERRGGYLVFLGRMGEDKGAHRAIEVAQAAGIPLKLAGKNNEPAEQEYFERYVRPHLGNGVEYLGEVSHDHKVELLRHAAATLFPIEWSEPFGLVMIESMACGTPVLATNYGAVPEVVEDGVGGVIVDDFRQMVEALPEVVEFDREQVRGSIAGRFDAPRMVADYERAYEAAIVGTAVSV